MIVDFEKLLIVYFEKRGWKILIVDLEKEAEEEKSLIIDLERN